MKPNLLPIRDPDGYLYPDDKTPNRHRKIPLTKKQIKAKAAAKRAKQARKINRK